MAATPEQPKPSPSVFEEVYTTGTAPWVIGEPQPAIVTLERQGWIRGKVLDVGCGSGEHTIYLTARGYDVCGVDSSPRAVEQARANAAAHNVMARFEVADVFAFNDHPTDDPIYDTVIDSALFHLFGASDRTRYVRSLHRACRPGALVHVLALADTGPGFGPQISDTVIREAFTRRWVLEDLRSAQFRGIVVRSAQVVAVNRRIGELVDLPAWLARARRL
jgi:SAM-dependent methyltransferase